MRSLFFLWALFALSLFLGPISCTTTPTTTSREVAGKPALNPERVRYLRQAADAGVIFLINDNAFRDMPTKQVGSCRKTEESAWSENLFGILEGFAPSPNLYSKIHLIEVRRGNEAKTTLEKESDGAVRLVISYMRRMSYEKINPFTELPCGNVGNQYVNRDLEVTTYDWPTRENVLAALTIAEDKPLLPRFHFDKKFLLFLADRLAILKVTPDNLYEKTPTGEYALSTMLNKLGAELGTGIDTKNIDFWMKEISMRSKQAASLEYFGLNKDYLLGYGVKVDSAGKLSRKINNYSDPTYLHISFRADSGTYLSASLQDLNTCLANLTELYKGHEFVKTFDTDKDSYLYPGYSCREKKNLSDVPQESALEIPKIEEELN